MFIRGIGLIGLTIGIIAGLLQVKHYNNILESPCECGIEPPGCISHGVSNTYDYSLITLCLTTNHDVTGSSPGSSTILNVD